MDGSRALSRCLQQLSIQNQSCLRSHTVTAVATHRLRAPRNSSRPTTKLRPSSRPFSTSHRNNQENSSPSESQDAQSPPQPQSSAQQPSPERSTFTRRLDLSSLVDDPEYQPPPPRRTKDAKAAAEQKAMAQSVSSQIDALLVGERARQAATQSRRPSNYDTYGTGGALFNKTRDPTRAAGPPPSLSELTNSVKNLVGGTVDTDQRLRERDRERAAARDQLRLHPSLGKSVDVNDAAGFNVTRAFITLEARINGRGNAVRKEEKEQKFHVRRGQKKKLKARERWRIVFREGFLGECARVRKMIRQGW